MICSYNMYDFNGTLQHKLDKNFIPFNKPCWDANILIAILSYLIKAVTHIKLLSWGEGGREEGGAFISLS